VPVISQSNFNYHYKSWPILWLSETSLRATPLLTQCGQTEKTARMEAVWWLSYRVFLSSRLIYLWLILHNVEYKRTLLMKFVCFLCHLSYESRGSERKTGMLFLKNQLLCQISGNDLQIVQGSLECVWFLNQPEIYGYIFLKVELWV
jgi:hypothetical protein